MKQSRLLLKTAAILQILTGCVHSISFFVSPQPKNDTEKQLYELLNTYMFDFGNGFHRTMGDLVNNMSACFTLIYFFGGILNLYLLRKNVAPDVLRGVMNIHVLIFGIVFAVTVMLAFLPPILFTGAVFVSLLAARLFYKTT